MTVSAAPSATARRNCGDATSASGTRPLPENFFNSAWARKMEVIEPAKVVIVAHVIAVRKLAAFAPKREATPLKLSFAPFE